MDALFGTMRRLHDRGRSCRGLVVDEDGAALGPDYALVRRTPDGYRCANKAEIDWLLRLVFDGTEAPARFASRLDAIAKALDAGRVVRAQLLGLQIPLEPLDDARLERLERAASLIKAGFDPNQPRDDDGQWTDTGAATGVNTEDARPGSVNDVRPRVDTGGAVDRATPVTAAGAVAQAAASSAGAVSSSLWTAAGRAMVPALVNFAARISVPTAILNALLIPSNRSNVSEGTLPDRADIAYRYDEGALSLYHVDGSIRRLLFQGMSGLDGLYRDEDRGVIGRNLGDTFVLDSEVLPTVSEMAAKPRAKARARDRTEALATDVPKLCPEPSPDQGGEKAAHQRSLRAIAYQIQITGLPPGLAIEFNGVLFDGCDPNTGFFKEAMGEGYEWAMKGGKWQRWFTGIKRELRQMKRQSEAAGNRIVEYHVAEKPVADFLRKHAKRYKNIRVFHTQARDFGWR